MKNKLGFVSKNLPQPDYYQKFFDMYAGVYIINNGENIEEYHLQITGNIAIGKIDGIEILRQDLKCRTPITYKTFKTVKSAVEHLMKYFEKNNLI